MNLFRATAKSGPLMRMARLHQGLASSLRYSTRHFSTETQPPSQVPTSDPFLQTPSSPSVGLLYARLHATTKYTTKTDVLKLLDGCTLSVDDVKFEYNNSFIPLSVLIRFPSRQAYDAGIKSIVKKGRYRLEPPKQQGDGSNWDSIAPYDGKTILLQGVPPNALQEDIERFLSGCTFDSPSIQILSRQSRPPWNRMALVRFPSQALATHAFITKNRGFCLNNQILVRVLH